MGLINKYSIFIIFNLITLTFSIFAYSPEEVVIAGPYFPQSEYFENDLDLISADLNIKIKSFGKPDYYYTKFFIDLHTKIDYVVGDRVDTDIYFAKKIDAYSILVNSGVKNFLPEDEADLRLNSFSDIVPFVI